MSNDFKGVPGGDPSRRPAKVLHEISCAVCNADMKILGKMGQTLPETCSAPCKNIKATKDAVKELQRFGIHLKEDGNRSLYGVTRLLEMCILLENITKGKKVYPSGDIICGACGETFSYYSPETFNGNRSIRKYCSRTCQRNKNIEGSVKGRMCPRPEKVKYVSEAEVEAKLSSLAEAEDFRDKGDAVPYECPCGAWHYGSSTKNLYQLEEKRLLSERTEQFNSILKANPVLLHGTAKKNKRRKYYGGKAA